MDRYINEKRFRIGQNVESLWGEKNFRNFYWTWIDHNIHAYTQSVTNTYTNKRVMLINNDTMKTLSDWKYLIAISSAITLQLFLLSILFQYYVGSIILLSSFFMYSFITPFCCKLYKIVIVYSAEKAKNFLTGEFYLI